MICPRCQEDTEPVPHMGAMRCMQGPFGWPCGQELGPLPKGPPKPVLERDVMRRAIAWLRAQPDCTVERVNVFTQKQGERHYRSANVGSPDLHCSVAGRVLFVECKRPGGKQSEGQKKYQKRVEAKGCVYIVEDSPELRTLKATVQIMRTGAPT